MMDNKQKHRMNILNIVLLAVLVITITVGIIKDGGIKSINITNGSSITLSNIFKK